VHGVVDRTRLDCIRVSPVEERIRFDQFVLNQHGLVGAARLDCLDCDRTAGRRVGPQLDVHCGSLRIHPVRADVRECSREVLSVRELNGHALLRRVYICDRHALYQREDQPAVAQRGRAESVSTRELCVAAGTRAQLLVCKLQGRVPWHPGLGSGRVGDAVPLCRKLDVAQQSRSACRSLPGHQLNCTVPE